MNGERRRAPRYQFIADAEVVEIESGTTFSAKTGDLSLGGCFLDMLNPSPEGSEIRVTIIRENNRFVALG
ncbi:MAG: PilZ domain-containing protein, partial [Candidatus Acidiferrum sp.]